MNNTNHPSNPPSIGLRSSFSSVVKRRHGNTNSDIQDPKLFSVSNDYNRIAIAQPPSNAGNKGFKNVAPDVSGGTQRTVYFPENEFSRPRNFSQPTLFSIGDGVNRRDHHNVRRVSLDSNEQHTQVGVNASSSTSHPNPPLVPTRQLKPSLSLPENRQKNDQTGEFPLPAQKCVLLPDTSEREGVSSSRSESHSALKDKSYDDFTSNYSCQTFQRQLSLTVTQPEILYAVITLDLQRKLNQGQGSAAPFYIDKISNVKWMNHPTELLWDFGNQKYVDLPLSAAYRKKRIENGKVENVAKWTIIEERLIQLKTLCERAIMTNREVDFSSAMKETVKSYSDKMSTDCNFRILRNKELTRMLLLATTKIVDRCLELGGLVATPIPKLQRGTSHTLYLTRRLCCSLLANAFFCTIPHDGRNPAEIPPFNFLKLFHEGDEGAERSAIKAEKIKCVLEYFLHVSSKIENKQEMDSLISFERRCLPSAFQPDWAKSNQTLCEISASTDGVIEDAEGHLQVDFANKYIGGGILGQGMVQEEIRFAMCPDLFVSRLFTEALRDNEVMVITGAKQFNDYSGYRTTFKLKRVETPKPLDRDKYGRELVTLVAMDALKFKRGFEYVQYEMRNIDRELNKAYNGFYREETNSAESAPIATGNWGCGAFNGDADLKCLLQWMAASEAGRPHLVYYTVGDADFSKDINEIAQHLKTNGVSVSQLYKILKKYLNSRFTGSLFEFVKKLT